MRRPIAILFFMLSLVTTETGIQLLKLPVLIVHYSDHLAEGRSKSLAGFLFEHYSTSQHFDEDKKQDQQLPFKMIGAESFQVLYIPSTPFVSMPSCSESNQGQLASLYSFTLQDHFKGIFHPPRESNHT